MNRPPALTTTTTVWTHTDLAINVPLSALASDPENDPIFFRITAAQNCVATLSPDGSSVRFQPQAGYSGPSQFTLAADDGLSPLLAATTVIDVTVSGEPLLRLDFSARRPQFDAGDIEFMTVVGDFADQQDVVLDPSYLTFTTLDPHVAAVAPTGRLGALQNGNTVLVAAHGSVQAATAVSVGPPSTTLEQQLQSAGLNVYPTTLALSSLGGTRQFLAGVGGGSFELTDSSTGTRYFAGNTALVNITPDGLATALAAGTTRSQSSTARPSSAFQCSPSCRKRAWSLSPLLVASCKASTARSWPCLPVFSLNPSTSALAAGNPRQPGARVLPNESHFAGAFQLELGESVLEAAVQLAIPVGSTFEPGTRVYFHRLGELIGEQGVPVQAWIQVESGIVGEDGFVAHHFAAVPGGHGRRHVRLLVARR